MSFLIKLIIAFCSNYSTEILNNSVQITQWAIFLIKFFKRGILFLGNERGKGAHRK